MKTSNKFLRIKERSIQFKYFKAVLMVVIIPMVVAPIVGYMYSSNLLREKLERVTVQSLENIETNMNHIIDDAISASNVIALDFEIKDFLEKEPMDFKEEIQLNVEGERKLHYMEASNLFDYVAKTVLVDFHGRVYDTGENNEYNYGEIVKTEWYKEALDRRGFFIWHAPGHDILDLKDGMTLVRLIQDDYYNPLGVLLIHLYPEGRLEEVMELENEFDGTIRFLLNNSDEVILTTDVDDPNGFTTTVAENTDSLLKDIMEGPWDSGVVELGDEKAFIGTRTIEKTGWKLFQVTPYDSIMSEVSVYRNIMIWMNVCFVIILLMVLYFITSGITKNIKTLSHTMNKVTKGNLEVRSQVVASREVNQLRDSFNFMIERMNGLLSEVEDETLKQQKNKLEALQAQINPHFLLNTLNGIKLLCVIESAPTAEKMLVSLGYLLENTLGKYNDFVSLEEEIECLRNYVKLQKMRFGKTFEVHYEIDKGAEKVKVPVLLLQPIVENSILHAFDEMDEVGIISIQAFVRENYLEIWVTDNGKGMTEETIERLMTVSARKGKYSKMGVKNVLERIELYYEPPCGLGMESVLDQGTKTVLLIKPKELDI